MISEAQLRSVVAAYIPRRFAVGKSAAVLVPILYLPTGLELLFTKRPETLRAHPGQVSFPGGRIDPGDASVSAAALRETHEELGIAAADIEIIGALDDVVTGTGFTISPVIGLLRERPTLTPNAAEVEAAFWLPLDRLLAENAWRGMDITRSGHTFKVWFFDDAPYTIWGATAAVAKRLVALLGPV